MDSNIRLKLYNKFLENVILPIGDLLSGTNVMQQLNNWRNISNLSESQINKISYDKLFKILDFASSNIPFYYKYQNQNTNNSVEWLKQFPIMGKSDIRNNITKLTSIPISQLIKSESSGSSGERSVIYKSKQDFATGWAIIFFIWSWAGYYPGKPLLQTGMSTKRSSLKKIKDYFLNTKYFIAFGLNNSEMKSLLNLQARKKNYHLAGYASSLYALAETAIEEKIKDVQFDTAISFGDKLFPHYKRKIKEAFNCKVIDTYGLSEGLTIAAQKDLEYYYILSPHVFIEIIDEQGNEVDDGELGYVIATSLDAYAMPLIRFYTGDLAVKLPRNKYPKKREMNFPLLEKIVGRDTDIIRTKKGKYIIVHFFTVIFEQVEAIKQFKVIQRNLEGIEIEYIPNRYFSLDILYDIEKKILDYINEDFNILWKKVEIIKPTPSGKPQIIESHI